MPALEPGLKFFNSHARSSAKYYDLLRPRSGSGKCIWSVSPAGGSGCYFLVAVLLWGLPPAILVARASPRACKATSGSPGLPPADDCIIFKVIDFKPGRGLYKHVERINSPKFSTHQNFQLAKSLHSPKFKTRQNIKLAKIFNLPKF